MSSVDVFASGTSGVAALDTPQLTQTKLEIRAIVAEIAQLSATLIPSQEFFSAILPRICTAMGATSAAVWQLDQTSAAASHWGTGTNSVRPSEVANPSDSPRGPIAHYRLPSILNPHAAGTDALTEAAQQAQRNHQRILDCVAEEGAPILVPPNSVRVTVERPTNPLDECLLIVPIKIDQQSTILLEVIQPASGGPAAQRGYLRFVAQMADLVADFLRRARLQEYAERSKYVLDLQDSLIAIAAAEETTTKQQRAASALARLVKADLAILIGRKRVLGWPIGWHVQAINDLPTFDSRSQIVLLAERFIKASAPARRPQIAHLHSWPAISSQMNQPVTSRRSRR